MIGNTDAAIEFLGLWFPEGPWTLTSILDSVTVTRTFRREQFEEMYAWIEENNGKRNLYFTLNKIREGVSKKPSKADVTEIVALHLDVDPRVGEEIPLERQRILKSLQEFKPHPSAIIDSGTGYQAYWLLETPIVLDGTEATTLEAESYSIQLELLLGGDRCSNCDRVMRIPGTVNIPNEVKRKKGRVAALSSLIEWTGTRYPLSLFTKAPTKIQPSVKGGSPLTLAGGGEKIKIGSVQPIYVDELRVTIPDSVKVLIIHGTDPDEPSKYPSRSEALWAVVCALARAGADDNTIAGIIMNRENKISASVLDKPRPERYAAKQIQDAREEVHDPNLRELNSKHAVISDIGGKCRIISEVYDYALRRPRVSYQSFQDFMNRYCNRKVQVATDADGKPILRPMGKWWTENPERRQYDTIVFSPGQEVPKAYNLWQGFACEAIPGECGLFLDHIRLNLCQGDLGYYEYLLSWMARCVQQPDCAGEVAVVLRGEMGTGKGVFAKGFGSLFGRHFLQVSDPKHLVGSFNSHLRDCVVLFGDEAFYAGDKKHESVLKALVTEETLAIESKGVDVVASPNYTHIILGSNTQWVVPAGSNERRYFVLEVGSDKMQDKKYFAAVKKQMSEGGREALLHTLLNRDIAEFEVREVPKTAALQEQKRLSMSPEEVWWYEKLEEGRILKKHDGWERNIIKGELQDDYIYHMTRIGILRKASATTLGIFLSKVCPGGTPRSYQEMAQVTEHGPYGEEYRVARRVYFYELPELAKCRAHWDQHFGGPFKWNKPLEKAPEPKPPEDIFK